jgi:hypothetical protein
MTRNPFRSGSISENPADIGPVSRKLALGRTEQLAIINGAWLHQANKRLVEEGVAGAGRDQMLQATRPAARADSRLV